jgi:hypothetical protein
MLALWQIERADDATLKSSLFARASELLDMAEGEIGEDLLPAFVETRGLVLIAGGDVRQALAHFQSQILHYGRGGWIGVRLGEQRARILLGEQDDVDLGASPNSGSARFALYVMQVIKALSDKPQESKVRELLKTLFPRAADFAARVQPNAQGGQSIRNGAEMLGTFLQTCWFRPAKIQTLDDLDRPGAAGAVLKRVNDTRTVTFDVISNSALALAA